MELVKIKKEWWVNYYPVEIDGDVCRYFDKRWKKTKRFEVKEVDDVSNIFDELSWLKVCQLTEKYGYRVGFFFADRKVATIVADNFLRRKMFIYNIIKDDIKQIENFNEQFFDCLQVNYHLSLFGALMFDIIKTDECLGELVPEYNPNECTYKGKEKVSINKFIEEHFGKKYEKLVEKIIDEGV